VSYEMSTQRALDVVVFIERHMMVPSWLLDRRP
jgi:hypothetical protein